MERKMAETETRCKRGKEEKRFKDMKTIKIQKSGTVMATPRVLEMEICAGTKGGRSWHFRSTY